MLLVLDWTKSPMHHTYVITKQTGFGAVYVEAATVEEISRRCDGVWSASWYLTQSDKPGTLEAVGRWSYANAGWGQA